MRVSEFQIFTTFLHNLQRLRLENLETQTQISSGKRVVQPSDDPISFERILSSKSSLAITEQRLRNIQFATTRLDSADSSLNSSTTVLLRAKELAVQLRDDTNSREERATAAKETQQLFNELLQLGNTRLDGQSIFTGTSTHGRATGLSIREPITVTDGVNDTLTVVVDGVTSGTIDLTAGTETLTGSQLASRIQSRINTDATLSAAGKSVTVTFGGDRLFIASNSFGPSSTVRVTSGTALATVGFNGGGATDGSDPFALLAHTSAAIGNTGSAVIAQGSVRDPNQATLDDYVLRFSSATSFSVFNISKPVAVSPGAANAGGASVSDRGVSAPSQVRLDDYEIRLQSLFTVTAANGDLRFDPGSGPPVTVTIPPGRYTGDQLAVELNTQMDAASGGDTYTVTFDGATGEFSILNNAANAGSVDLMFDDPATTAEGLLGFPDTLTTVQLGETATGGDAIVTSGAELRHYVENTSSSVAMFTLTGANNTLYLNGSPVTLTEGSYTGTELAAEIQARLGAGYTVSYNTAAGRPARFFDITNNTAGAVTLNHSNSASTVSELLGFEPVDSALAPLGGNDTSDFDAGTTGYLSGTNIEFGGLRVALNDVTGAPRHGDVFAVSLGSVAVLSNQFYTSQASIDFAGIQVSVRDGAGTPATGDLFRILVTSQYQGDSGIQAIEVADNQTVQTNLPGDEVFSGPTIDILTALKNLTTALSGDYGGGIAQAIDDLDNAIEQVSSGRGKVGALTNRLESTSNVLEVTRELLTETLSQHQDADLITLISELAQQETAIEAAAAAGARIFQSSLLNFLR